MGTAGRTWRMNSCARFDFAKSSAVLNAGREAGEKSLGWRIRRMRAMSLRRPRLLEHRGPRALDAGARSCVLPLRPLRRGHVDLDAAWLLGLHQDAAVTHSHLSPGLFLRRLGR